MPGNDREKGTTSFGDLIGRKIGRLRGKAHFLFLKVSVDIERLAGHRMIKLEYLEYAKTEFGVLPPHHIPITPQHTGCIINEILVSRERCSGASDETILPRF